MKEEEIKKLMQDSLVETSDAFTSQLMQQLKAEQAQQAARISWFQRLTVALVSICIIAISIMLFQFSFMRIPLFIGCLLVLLLGLNQVFFLRSVERKLRLLA